MRQGMNALNVIEGVKQKLREIAPSLPPGVQIMSGYDRSGLIEDSIATLQRDLLEEAIIVSVVIIVFLFHFRSALIAIVTLPIARPGLLHSDLLLGRQRQHHVSRRIGTCHRRTGRCGDCHGREWLSALVRAAASKRNANLRTATPRILINAAKQVGPASSFPCSSSSSLSCPSFC